MLGAQSKAHAAQQFFNGVTKFGVVGASSDRNKYGNKVLRWYLDRKLAVTPINPRGGSIESVQSVKNVAEFVEAANQPTALSIITPPSITNQIMQEAHAAGVQSVWMQPGSESAEAVAFGQEHGMTVVHDYCILVSGDAARSQTSKF